MKDVMKHLTVNQMMSDQLHLLPEHVADFAVMQTEYNDNEATRIITNLINKCIDDHLKS